MTTKALYPRMGYESNGRLYRLSAYSIVRNYTMGDAGFVSIEFPVAVIDRATNMIYAEITYRIIETSFKQEVSIKNIDKHQGTIDHIIIIEGSFVEPKPPGKDIVLALMKKLMKYLERNKQNLV